jgi:hypothetical protein
MEGANSAASLTSPLRTDLLTRSWFLLGPPRLSRIDPRAVGGIVPFGRS